MSSGGNLFFRKLKDPGHERLRPQLKEAVRAFAKALRHLRYSGKAIEPVLQGKIGAPEDLEQVVEGDLLSLENNRDLFAIRSKELFRGTFRPR